MYDFAPNSKRERSVRTPMAAVSAVCNLALVHAYCCARSGKRGGKQPVPPNSLVGYFPADQWGATFLYGVDNHSSKLSNLRRKLKPLLDNQAKRRKDKAFVARVKWLQDAKNKAAGDGAVGRGLREFAARWDLCGDASAGHHPHTLTACRGFGCCGPQSGLQPSTPQAIAAEIRALKGQGISPVYTGVPSAVRSLDRAVEALVDGSPSSTWSTAALRQLGKLMEACWTTMPSGGMSLPLFVRKFTEAGRQQRQKDLAEKSAEKKAAARAAVSRQKAANRAGQVEGAALEYYGLASTRYACRHARARTQARAHARMHAHAHAHAHTHAHAHARARARAPTPMRTRTPRAHLPSQVQHAKTLAQHFLRDKESRAEPAYEAGAACAPPWRAEAAEPHDVATDQSQRHGAPGCCRPQHLVRQHYRYTHKPPFLSHPLTQPRLVDPRPFAVRHPRPGVPSYSTSHRNRAIRAPSACAISAPSTHSRYHFVRRQDQVRLRQPDPGGRPAPVVPCGTPHARYARWS